MKKKILSLVLAVAMIVSIIAVSAVSVAADDEVQASLGQYPNHGKYSGQGVKQRLMFAMPGAWQNDITKDPRCNGVAGLYWWSGYGNCKEQGWPNEWPGYECDKVEEDGVENLYYIDAPNFGNGNNNTGTIVWNNYIDGGLETDSVKNPFHDAAQQSTDFIAGYDNHYDGYDIYDPLFRYIYQYNLKKLIPSVADLDIKSDDFWDDINKKAAEYLGEEYDSDNWQIDIILDELDPQDLDFSVFGKYASNFFNSDLVGDLKENGELIREGHPVYKEMFPGEKTCLENGLAFHYDNMVFVIDFDPERMSDAGMGNKTGYGGDFYFYYGNGNYGSWPTEELNEDMGGVKGNFMSDEYWKSKPIEIPTTAPTDSSDKGNDGSNGSDDSTKAGAATLNSASNSNGVTTNGAAVQTGSVTFAVIFLAVLAMVAGIVWFARKRKFD